MPTYDYECHGCGKRFELFHAPSAPRPKKCPLCGYSDTGSPQRLISGGTGIIFKGSGFYATDYRAKRRSKR